MTTVQTIRERQGLGRLSPEEYAKAREDKRAQNVVNAREILQRNGVLYRDFGRCNGNVHFVIKQGPDEFWYWPEEGLWLNIALEQPERHFGCRNLVKHLKGECK